MYYPRETCRYFLQGTCNKGKNCTFYHDLKKQPKTRNLQSQHESNKSRECTYTTKGYYNIPQKCDLEKRNEQITKSDEEESDQISEKNFWSFNRLIHTVVEPVVGLLFEKYWKNTFSTKWNGDEDERAVLTTRGNIVFDNMNKENFTKGWEYWDLEMKLNILVHSPWLVKPETDITHLKNILKYAHSSVGFKKQYLSTHPKYRELKKNILQNVEWLLLLNYKIYEKLIQKHQICCEILGSIEISPDDEFISLYSEIVENATNFFLSQIVMYDTNQKQDLVSLFQEKLHHSLFLDIRHQIEKERGLPVIKQRFVTILQKKINPFYASFYAQERYQHLYFKDASGDLQRIVLETPYYGQRYVVPDMINFGVWDPVSPDGRDVKNYVFTPGALLVYANRLEDGVCGTLV